MESKLGIGLIAFEGGGGYRGIEQNSGVCFGVFVVSFSPFSACVSDFGLEISSRYVFNDRFFFASFIRWILFAPGQCKKHGREGP